MDATLVTGREYGHWTRKWLVDANFAKFQNFYKISSHGFQIIQKQIQTLSYQFQIHKKHQNSSQIKTFDQYSSINQQPKFQNAKPQILKPFFLTT